MMEHKLLASPAHTLAAPEIKQAHDRGLAVNRTGEFEGYASLFGIADLGGDVVSAGAFTQSLQKRGASGVKMLWQHNAAEPIGAWESLIENAKGLRVRGRLNLDVTRAREVHSLMREGSVDGLSIGFRTLKSFRDRKSGLRHLEQLDLWEISVVTFPMLPQARVSAVKREAPSTGGEFGSVVLAGRRVQAALRRAAHHMF